MKPEKNIANCRMSGDFLRAVLLEGVWPFKYRKNIHYLLGLGAISFELPRIIQPGQILHFRLKSKTSQRRTFINKRHLRGAQNDHLYTSHTDTNELLSIVKSKDVLNNNRSMENSLSDEQFLEGESNQLYTQINDITKEISDSGTVQKNGSKKILVPVKNTLQTISAKFSNKDKANEIQTPSEIIEENDNNLLLKISNTMVNTFPNLYQTGNLTNNQIITPKQSSTQKQVINEEHAIAGKIQKKKIPINSIPVNKISLQTIFAEFSNNIESIEKNILSEKNVMADSNMPLLDDNASLFQYKHKKKSNEKEAICRKNAVQQPVINIFELEPKKFFHPNTEETGIEYSGASGKNSQIYEDNVQLSLSNIYGAREIINKNKDDATTKTNITDCPKKGSKGSLNYQYRPDAYVNYPKDLEIPYESNIHTIGPKDINNQAIKKGYDYYRYTSKNYLPVSGDLNESKYLHSFLNEGQKKVNKDRRGELIKSTLKAITISDSHQQVWHSLSGGVPALQFQSQQIEIYNSQIDKQMDLLREMSRLQPSGKAVKSENEDAITENSQRDILKKTGRNATTVRYPVPVSSKRKIKTDAFWQRSHIGRFFLGRVR